MKADKRTLIAVKQFIQNQEGWDLDELIGEIAAETKVLNREDLEEVGLEPDECSIEWDGDTLCGLDEFIEPYTIKLLEKICNVLESFQGEDISEHEFEE